MIEVKNLVKRYGNHVAVDHLSFTVEKGQIYGFLGPNGAGKSTTMNIITGYIASTEGTVLVDGHDILKEPEAAKRCIGYLPEQPPLYMDMTVTEYLKFVQDLKQIKKGERREMLRQVMEMTGISEVSERVIKNLSKGFRQRVGLAQALIGFPEILILDEPTVGLDPKQMTEIRSLIRELSKDHTVILSSHILSEVSAVCDHILIISKGKLAASDTPENLSRAMAGEQKLALSVKGGADQVEGVLKGMEEVSEFEVLPSGEDGLWKVSLTAQPEKDIRERLFWAMADAGLPIMEMRLTGMSLEDVFLELTESDEEAVGGWTESSGESGSVPETETEGQKDGEEDDGAETPEEEVAGNGSDL